MPVRRAGIDQQQRHSRGVGVERDGLHRRRLEVRQQRSLRFPEQRRELVHQSGGRADIVVLGALRDSRLLDPVDPKVRCEGQRAEHRAFECRRRRHTRSHLDLTADRHRPAVNRMPGPAKRPDDARHIGCPAVDVTGRGIERDRHLAVLVIASHGDVVGVGGGVGHHGALRQCDRQREAQVVVGVLADQIDPAGRRVDHPAHLELP